MAHNFIWYELAATDKPAAEAFYKEIVGWTLQRHEGGIDYTVLEARDGQVGGIGAVPEEPWARPGWSGYVGVDDVDAVAARITRAGGSIVRPPDDIPGVGRFAVVADPQGVRFMLLRGSVPDHAPPQAFKPNTPGHIGWNELHTTDWKAGFKFYAELFGWEKIEAMDMGAMGTYQIFGIDGAPIGGRMNSPNIPDPTWLFYVIVDDFDAAHRRVVDHGAAVVHGPAQVPGGSWIVQATDPHGVLFAVVGPRK